MFESLVKIGEAPAPAQTQPLENWKTLGGQSGETISAYMKYFSQLSPDDKERWKNGSLKVPPGVKVPTASDFNNVIIGVLRANLLQPDAAIIAKVRELVDACGLHGVLFEGTSTFDVQRAIGVARNAINTEKQARQPARGPTVV